MISWSIWFFREHDWFKMDLPNYLFPQSSDVDASIIDTEVIQEVCEVYFCMDITSIL